MYSRSNINGVRTKKHELSNVAKEALRRYSSTDSQDIAVIGGGITGLASAFWISTLPGTRVTLYEKGKTLGGWLRTKHVNVGNGTILFEQGPRAIRPSGPNALLTKYLVLYRKSWSFSWWQKDLRTDGSWLYRSKISTWSTRWSPHPPPLSRLEIVTSTILIVLCVCPVLAMGSPLWARCGESRSLEVLYRASWGNSFAHLDRRIEKTNPLGRSSRAG